jgi:serine/threonine protein kinase
MFHLSDLAPPRTLLCKTPTNPLDSMQQPCQLLLGNLQGHQAQVYKSNIREIGDVLIKVMKPDSRPIQGLDEIVALEVSMRLAGIPVAELLSFHEWNEYGMIQNAIVYRYYSGGDLFAQISKLHQSKAISAERTEFLAYRVVKMLCTCLANLHTNGWVHADVKPENIFLSKDIESEDCESYLGDFASAVRIGHPISPFTTGTPHYFPKQDFRNGFGPAHPSLDMFSVGKVLQVFHKYIFNLSPHACEVMGELLADEASRRPTAEQMLNTILPAWKKTMAYAQDKKAEC